MQSVINANMRGKTRAGLAGRKLIKCPHCRELLMDLDRNYKVELFSIPARKRNSGKYKEIKQCLVCGGKVGYNLITSEEQK